MHRHLAIILVSTFSAVMTATPAVAQEPAGAGQQPDGVQAAAHLVAPLPPEIGRPVQGPTPPENARSWLARRGITVGASHVAEAFRWNGAGSGSGQYLGSYAPSVTFDLARMKIARGQVHLGGQVLRQRAAGAETLQAVSNMEAPAFDKVAEAWYADSYLGGRLALKAGWHYADAEFGTVDAAASFLNGSYGANPTTPMPTYPDAALGVTASVSVTQWLSIGTAVFRGAERDADIGTPARMAPFQIVEARLAPLGPHSSIRVGVWRQAVSPDERAAGEDASVNSGVYATAERRFGTRGSDPGSGAWALFVQAGWAPAERNDVSRYLGGGVSRRGLLHRRPDDEVGVGVTSAVRGAGGRETGLELFYRLELRDGLFLQPDLQWIRRPAGGTGQAVVAGVRVGMEL